MAADFFCLKVRKSAGKSPLNSKFNIEVEDVIRYMVREGRFREYMKNKLDEQVDVSYPEDEKKQLQYARQKHSQNGSSFVPTKVW